MPSYILAKEAKKHVDVLLSGEGGDEVFNAYSIYTAWKVKKLYTSYCPKPVRKLAHWFAHQLPSDYRKLSFDFMAKRFTEGAELHPAAAHIYWRHPFTNNEKDSFLKFRDEVESTDNRLIKLFEEYNHADELNRITMLDVEHFIVDDLLVKNDRMFLAHSIESRFPFLDRILFDYTQTLPTDLKLKGFKGRYIEKLAMKRSLPREILKRDNYGLEMPHSIWFLDEFKPFLEKYINKKTVERVGFLDWDSVNHMWLNHQAKKRDYGRGIMVCT
jgi:asparagine synthase (glutamine-hydrolysing)